MNFFEKKGQGAIEYLLLLGAAIIVIAVVVSYMTGVLGPTIDSGNRNTYDYLCGPKSKGGLDTNSLLCGCYLKKSDRGEMLSSGEFVFANKSYGICPGKLDPKYENDPLLKWE